MSHTEPTSLSQTDEAARPSPSSSVANAGAVESTRPADQQPASSASVALSTDVAPASSTPLHEINADFWGQFEVVELGSDSGAVAHPLSMKWWHSEQDTDSLETSLQQVKQIDNCHFVRSKDGRIYILNGNRRTTLLWKHGQTSRGYMIPEDALAGLNCVAVVAALNNEVRHQTASQRALTAASFREEFAKEADRRRRAGTSWDNSHDPSNTGAVRDILGRLFHCDGKLVDAAIKVLKSNVSELIDAVRRDKLSVLNAAKILALPSHQHKVAVAAAHANDKAAVRSWLIRANEGRPKRGIQPVSRDRASAKESGATEEALSKAKLFAPESWPKGAIACQPSKRRPSPQRIATERPSTNSETVRGSVQNALDQGTANDVSATIADSRSKLTSEVETVRQPAHCTREANPLSSVAAADTELRACIREGFRAATVLIDPDWSSIDAHELAELPVHDVLAENAVVVVWAPPDVTPAIELLHGWGLQITESVVAIGKPTNGHGYFRQAHRIALIAKRGNPSRPEVRPFHSWCGDQLESYDRAHQDMIACMGEALPVPRLQIFGSVVSRHDAQWRSVACQLRQTFARPE